tara:strand:+ start:14949 stop:16763 length:1815 start_codon:yes stop_codon:yes gene_type:complete
MVKNSDLVAEFLKKQKIEIVFGIIGSANSYIFDSIVKLGYTKIICTHHEQSAVMAMGAYFRASGKLSASIVTAGAGSSNAITGVLSNWADSIPGLIISGQEQAKYLETHKDLRMYGIQGYDSPEAVKKITKYAKTLTMTDSVQEELEKGLTISISGRPGPVWLDIPFDMQGKMVEPREWITIQKTNNQIDYFSSILEAEVNTIYKKLTNSKRPVIIGGHGVRIAGAKKEFRDLVNKFKIPVILTWSGIDLLPENNNYNFGRSGVMGERSANFIIQNSDLIISLGSRLSILQTGYDLNDFAPRAELIINDIDFKESTKHNKLNTQVVNLDTGDLITALLSNSQYIEEKTEWLSYCNTIKQKYPKLLPEHDNALYINSYKFIDKLSANLKGNEIIVTDMGTALLSGHYSIKLKEHNIMFTSLGLGEMGYGLPGALGASLADRSKNVICLNCDGGMMLNLQELQTIKHHNLSVKIIIFNNDGYLMIKHTQKMLFKGNYNSVDAATGVSLPNFQKMSAAFDFPYYSVKTWLDYETNMSAFLETEGPAVCEVYMDPEQDFIPKVRGIKNMDGSIFAPPIEEMSPLISLKEVKENMISGINPKSNAIQRC